jgi:hypothetical protein
MDFDEVEAFTVFVWNQADPLFRFNDAAFHKRCIGLDPLGEQARRREADVRKHLGPESHICVLCGKKIEKWNQNIAFPYLAENGSGLHLLNYLQFHRTCLPKWSGLPAAARMLREALADDRLRGTTLEQLREELENALRG